MAKRARPVGAASTISWALFLVRERARVCAPERGGGGAGGGRREGGREGGREGCAHTYTFVPCASRERVHPEGRRQRYQKMRPVWNSGVSLCFSTAQPCRTRASTSSRTLSHSARRCQTQLPVVSLKFMETAEVKEGEAFMAVPGVSFGLDELFPKK